jgi:hypothetical protein
MTLEVWPIGGPHRLLQARACEVAAGSCTSLADHRAQKNWSASVLAVGVGLVRTGRPLGDPIAAVGSCAIFADAIMFTWLVFQGTTSASQADGRPVLAKN